MGGETARKVNVATERCGEWLSARAAYHVGTGARSGVTVRKRAAMLLS